MSNVQGTHSYSPVTFAAALTPKGTARLQATPAELPAPVAELAESQPAGPASRMA
jgi:hypothetical protein